MNTLPAIAGFLAVAAATPGPNNLVVMRTATHAGIAGTLPAIAGVVTGGLALLAALAAGAGAAFAAEPRLHLIITIGGCAYLVWLAVELVMRRPARDGVSVASVRAVPGTGFVGLFAFQFLNPKGWLMLLTAVSAAASASASMAFVMVAAIFVPVSLACLLLWAFCGTRLTAWLACEQPRIWFDRAAGLLLLGAAVLLLLEM